MANDPSLRTRCAILLARGAASMLALWLAAPAVAADPPPDQTRGAVEPAAAGPAVGEAREGGREPVGRIRGSVFDLKRRPVAGLLVQLASRGEQGRLRVTGTNEKGQYVFQDLPAGVYDVQLSTEFHGTQTKLSIEVRPPFQNIVDFQLARAGAPGEEGPAARPGAGAGAAASDAGGTPVPAGGVIVRGRLVDAEKHPVIEASIVLTALAGAGTYQAFSGEDGRFVLDGVEPGRYRALVVSPGHVPLDLKSVLVSAAGGLDLSLSLVDYPLSLKEQRDDLPPRERPRPAPARGDGDASGDAGPVSAPAPPDSTS